MLTLTFSACFSVFARSLITRSWAFLFVKSLLYPRSFTIYFYSNFMLWLNYFLADIITPFVLYRLFNLKWSGCRGGRRELFWRHGSWQSDESPFFYAPVGLLLASKNFRPTYVIWMTSLILLDNLPIKKNIFFSFFYEMFKVFKNNKEWKFF